ncbi:MAG TPA: hypothetical protein VMY88_07590, partial [Acidimicrobiales bacterium]|nr:hypothetical protein [Acidimicrobiales bacterium]
MAVRSSGSNASSRSKKEGGRRGPVAEDSLDGGATKLLGQPAGGRLNSLSEIVRELVEVGHDVLAYYPSALIRG